MEKLEVWRYWCSGGVVQWRCLIICMIVVGGFNCARPYLLTVLTSVKCWGSAHSNSDRQTLRLIDYDTVYRNIVERNGS